MRYIKNMCPRCGNELSKSTVEGYPFECARCDENFYGFEAEKALAIETPLGTLVCQVMSDYDDYHEFAIDLIRPDGGLVQCAVVGTSPDADGKPDLRVLAWDGNDEDPSVIGKVDPDGECVYR